MNKHPMPERQAIGEGGSKAGIESKRAEARDSSLRDLYKAHSGKVSDKWSIYLETYDRIFAQYRNRPVRILEIGVQNGGSLEIWRKYFPNAELIIGCDVNPACANLVFDDEKISIVIGDANTDEVERDILARSPKFDIIIDDGSHLSSDIVRSFARYFPHSTDGGLYIAEDLHCSYWQRFGGGLYDPLSSMSFFKRLLDVINHEHWGLKRLRVDVLTTFADRHKATFDEASLASVHSVEFLNSLCIVAKRPIQENVLGARLMAGLTALVEGSIMPLDGTVSRPADETESVWSLRAATMEEEIGTNRELIKHQAAHIVALSDKIAVAREQIRADELAIAQQKAEAILNIAEIKVLQGELSLAHTVKYALESKLTEHEVLVQEFKDSTSWRITAPLRTLSTNLRWVLRNLSPARVLEWWLSSGK
ncbi:class I SAM-dependent methyltransferase [Mesorhizobium sp. B2-1-8]|uniref:class I SAM-dependent methyltransferase n=1 Tax=Mesorhizobium sp. B2-1-8 TaxID=2589967 RepID=UPI00112714B4|nr:class I SAM-dependent methyltransferase [Mesorhizobium sp. B2-1-8]UCI18507.1 class I SAM-dependent methyltransferase [Mesorhizobium sp. B2-1-8]